MVEAVQCRNAEAQRTQSFRPSTSSALSASPRLRVSAFQNPPRRRCPVTDLNKLTEAIPVQRQNGMYRFARLLNGLLHRPSAGHQ